MIKNIDNSRFVILCYGLIFLVFGALNFLTPYNGDDYLYAFNYADGSRIESFLDVLQSQYHHYLTVNGRAVPHVFEQLFAGLTGKWMFDIFNSLCLLLLISIVSKIILKKNEQLIRYKLQLVCLTFVASLFLFSYPGQTIFWMAGSLNYLLPTILGFLTLLLFESKKSSSLVLLFLFPLIAGWCQEAISLPFCASLWLVLLIDRSYRTRGNAVIALGYTLGACLIVFSPGTLARLSTNEIQHDGGLLFLVLTKLLEFNACLNQLYIYWFSLFMMLMVCFMKKLQVLKKYRNLLILWVINSLFFFALGFGHERITFFLSVLSFVLVICFTYEIFSSRVKIRLMYVNSLLSLMVVGTVLYSLNVCYQHNVWNNQLISTILASEQENVVVPADNYGEKTKLIYPLKLTPNAHDAHNKGVAKYYGKASVQLLNPQLYQSIAETDVATNDSSKVMFRPLNTLDKELRFSNEMYYIQLPRYAFDKGINIQSFHKVNNENLLPHQKMIRSVLHTLDNGVLELNHYLLLKNDHCYCFIPSIPNNVDSLVIKINKEQTDFCSYTKKYN